jgi:hypothetical protein
MRPRSRASEGRRSLAAAKPLAVGVRSRRRLGSLSDTEAQQCWIRGGSLRQHGCIGADLVGTSAQSHRMVSVFTAGMSSSRPPHATRLDRVDRVYGCVVSMPISIDSSDRSPHTRRGLRGSCYDDRKRDSSGAGPLRAGRPGHGPGRRAPLGRRRACRLGFGSGY